MTKSIMKSAMAAAILAAGIGTAAAGSPDFQAYYENSQRLSSPHAYNHVPWPHFAKNDHTPHWDAFGRDLNGPPFRDSCDGMYYGTGDHSCGTMTGGPVGGLESRN